MEQIIDRIMPYKAGIRAWRFRKLEVEEKHHKRINDAMAKMSKYHMWISDKAGPTITDVARAVQRLKPDVIILDYDVQGCEEDELLKVLQSSGDIAHAVGHIEKITESGIDLGMVLNQMNTRGW